MKDIRELITEDIDPCWKTLARATQYYEQPLKDLKLKKPLSALYAEADTDEPIGQWVSNVPRPGDVAACLNRKNKKREMML